MNMRNRSLTLIFSMVLAGGQLTGCAHYGYADRPAESESPRHTRPVAVSTLEAEAYLGLDLGDLTGQFVDMLRREGISTLRWGPADREDVHIDCRVEEAHVTGYGTYLNVTSAVFCELRVDGVAVASLRRRHSSAAGLSEPAPTNQVAVARSLEHQAVVNVLAELAPTIARQTRALPPLSPEISDE
jgi:hypothetical protein